MCVWGVTQNSTYYKTVLNLQTHTVHVKEELWSIS